MREDYKDKPLKPGKVSDVVLELVICVLLAACAAYGMVKWVQGCGESYVDSEDVRHMYEC